ncbi:nucleoside transporter [Ophiocordyceps camponoti-floridani]|uniref:Nucleoside transporter n=1 Tax=Ophiocordyceps camponoti-floridani TaxID=2030778 RepID=A0A8H4Q7E1_9HYPO|nr:nucleoside transporter [Ophiocordyceps camponoti-floridani]
MGWANTINKRAATSPLGHWFRLQGSGHPLSRKDSLFLTEIRAGLATFFAMAYIMAVNSSIVADSGGPCVCRRTAEDPHCDGHVEYMLCVQGVKRDAVTATAAVSALASVCMGLFANLPIGLAPGMGLNAYFAYTVVGYHGKGPVPYRVALTAIFVEGFIFLFLALVGMRQWLARAIPHSIKVATGVGIGLFLSLIGFTYGEGIGLVVGAVATPTQLAGCSPSLLRDGACPGGDKMRNPTLWLAIFAGGILTVLLAMYRVRGAVIVGIILVSVISWPRDTPVTAFPRTPLGDDAFDFFRRVVSFHPIRNILNVQRWEVAEYGAQFGLALITFLYVDILDCTGTLYGMARFAGLLDPVTHDFEGSSVAYVVDAMSISVGAVLGIPPVTAFVESGAGISEGGKTGLTAVVTGLCFLVAVFFAPIFASIPPWATGCVLILVGSMMASSVTDINWKYMGDAVPAFLAIVLMPFTYSIANGLIGSICCYAVLNLVVWLLKLLSRGRIVPPNYADKEPWTWRIPGGFFPPWIVRLFKGHGRFWRRDSPAPTPDSLCRQRKLSSEPGADRSSSAETNSVRGSEWRAGGDR